MEDPDQVYKWKNFLIYSRRFIEDPDKVYEWKTFDVFSKIHWRCCSSFSMKTFWCIHKDLLKRLQKFINENFLIYSGRFFEHPE